MLGIWAHRQTLAAREVGAELRVLVLHRPIPPLRALRAANLTDALAPVRQPRRTRYDGLRVEYVRYLSPPRPWSYESWGAWAAPALAHALRRIRTEFAFDLIHAHYAVPAGDAVRRATPDVPLVLSVHGHDVQGPGAGGPNVRNTLTHARLVLANSQGTAERCRTLGARTTRVVHLGTDVPEEPTPRPTTPTLVTVAHLAARKHHKDVLDAMATLVNHYPDLTYVIVGDGPEREPLRNRARALGLGDRVELREQLPPDQARALARRASLFVMPSLDEAFGVAYVEAMAGGVPAIGTRGEDGPEEIAAAGPGIVLVPACDPGALATAIDQLLSDPISLERLGRQARETVQQSFTWDRCGRATVAAYGEVLGQPRAVGAEPYQPDNLLDRVSASSTLEFNYRRLEAREALIASRRLRITHGDVLSVGCGWHPGRQLFPAPAFRLVGVDVDPERVEAVIETGRADEAFVGQSGRLELPDGSFDVVLYRLVLHHIAYRGELAPSFQEAARLLRPGGAMVAIEPGLWHPVGLGLALANRVGVATAIHGTPDDIPLSPLRLAAEARAAGLVPEIHAVTYTWRRLPVAIQRALQPLDAVGSWPIAARFGHTLMLIARRPASPAGALVGSPNRVSFSDRAEARSSATGAGEHDTAGGSAQP